MSTSQTTRSPDDTFVMAAVTRSFESFYRAEYRRTVAIAMALVVDSGVAEDLAQDALLTLQRHWDRVSGYDNPQAWLRRVLVNRAHSWRRRLAVEARALARLGDPEPVEQISPATREVWEAVGRLPRRQREAVVLHYVAQLSVAEIGAALGCSSGSVKTHLHRARASLSESLSDWRDQS